MPGEGKDFYAGHKVPLRTDHSSSLPAERKFRADVQSLVLSPIAQLFSRHDIGVAFMNRKFSRAFVLAAVAALYYVAGHAALRLAILHPSISPVWPGTGIALAALLL